jgi:hypothetical protein
MDVCLYVEKDLCFLVSSFILPRLVSQLLNKVITMLLRLFELKGLIGLRLDKEGHLAELVCSFKFIYFFLKVFKFKLNGMFCIVDWHVLHKLTGML